jgi:hypothetical protein
MAQPGGARSGVPAAAAAPPGMGLWAPGRIASRPAEGSPMSGSSEDTNELRYGRQARTGGSMRVIDVDPGDLVISEELKRSGSARQFEERLKSSIEEIGLVEPLKVAPLPAGRYLVIDGIMRLKAIKEIKHEKPSSFKTVPVYPMNYDRRYELRYQTDIYQDLLPSQLAQLVEHLHQTEHIRKADIARYIGVSPTTLRNYTGLWRLLQRGGLFAKVVELMDVEVIPSSNPYAWLRLTAFGLRQVLEHDFTDGEEAEPWFEQTILDARRGKPMRFTIKFVEAVTDALPSEYYREGEDLRTVKRDLGLRRAAHSGQAQDVASPRSERTSLTELPRPLPQWTQVELMLPLSVDVSEAQADLSPAVSDPSEPDSSATREAVRHLVYVARHSHDAVLRTAACSFRKYLQ